MKRETGGSLFILGCLDLIEGAYTKARERLQASVTIYREIGFAGELGMALGGLGLAQRYLREEGQARDTLCEVLSQWGKCREYLVPVTNLPLAALMLADEGEAALALEFWVTATQHPLVGNSRWFEEIAGDVIRRKAEKLPLDVRKAAERKGRGRELYDTTAELYVIFNCECT